MTTSVYHIYIHVPVECKLLYIIILCCQALYVLFTCFIRNCTWSQSLPAENISMASVETRTVPCGCGGGVPLPCSASGRQLLTGLSSDRMLMAWKSLLDEKLDELNSAVDGKVTGYVCRKCFRAFQSFSETKFKLMTARYC